MLKIAAYKLDVPMNAVEELADGSVRIVTYNEPAGQRGELVELRDPRLYYGGATEYRLRINVPPQRCVVLDIVVSHTSANAWRVVVINNNGCEIYNRKTLGEVNDFLKSLFK